MSPLKSISVRVLAALALASFAAAADEPIDLGAPSLLRPITLPRGTADVTARGDFSNYDANGDSETGVAVALGVDLGVTPRLQLGLAAAFASAPAYGPGDLLATAAFALTRNVALRVDGGYEKRGGDGVDPVHFGLAGIGVPLRLPLGGPLAFVSGDTSAARFAHFVDFGLENVDAYDGTAFAATHADLVSVIAGSAGTEIGLNLPLGILWQLQPSVALELSTGFAVTIDSPSGASASATEFIPVGLDAIFDLDSQFALGLGVSFAGTLHSSEAANASTFANTRFAQAWVRFRTADLF